MLDLSTTDTSALRRLIRVPAPGYSAEEFAAEMIRRIPELKLSRFTIDNSKGSLDYFGRGKIKIGGYKVLISKLIATKISEDNFHVMVSYDRPAFRPFLFLFCCIGFLFGLVPGLIIWFIFRENDSDVAQRVQPALERFEALLKEPPFLPPPLELDVRPTIDAASTIVEDTTIDSLKGRLAKLATLREQDLISEEEYAKLRGELLATI